MYDFKTFCAKIILALIPFLENFLQYPHTSLREYFCHPAPRCCHDIFSNNMCRIIQTDINEGRARRQPKETQGSCDLGEALWWATSLLVGSFLALKSVTPQGVGKEEQFPGKDSFCSRLNSWPSWSQGPACVSCARVDSFCISLAPLWGGAWN